MRSSPPVTIPGALAVAILTTAAGSAGAVLWDLYGKSSAATQHAQDLRELKAMRDRELDSLDRRITALEARTCKP